MSDPSAAPALTPDATNRLAEFSRVCKAAARAVSLYPGGHPAIGVSLTRLEQATARMTEAGRLCGKEPLSVGAAMRNGGGHPLKEGPSIPDRAEIAAKTAHAEIFPNPPAQSGL